MSTVVLATSMPASTIRLIRDGKNEFLPDERELAREVVDRLVKHLVVGDRDNSPAELPCTNPHPRVFLFVHPVRLTHFENAGLEKPEGNDVTVGAAHLDAVATTEGVASADDEIAGERRHRLLSSDCETSCDQPADETDELDAKRIHTPGGSMERALLKQFARGSTAGLNPRSTRRLGGRRGKIEVEDGSSGGRAAVPDAAAQRVDDAIADREAKAGALADRLGREARLKKL